MQVLNVNFTRDHHNIISGTVKCREKKINPTRKTTSEAKNKDLQKSNFLTTNQLLKKLIPWTGFKETLSKKVKKQPYPTTRELKKKNITTSYQIWIFTGFYALLWQRTNWKKKNWHLNNIATLRNNCSISLTYLLHGWTAKSFLLYSQKSKTGNIVWSIKCWFCQRLASLS